MCSWCRFDKCLSIGMRTEMVESDGRRTKSVAKKIALKQERKPSPSPQKKSLNEPLPEANIQDTFSQSPSKQHDYLSVIRSPESCLQFRVKELKGIPYLGCQIILEISTVNGTVQGTTRSLDSFATKQCSPDHLESGSLPFTLSLKYPTGCQTFHKRIDKLLMKEESFDVIVSCFSSKHITLMESMDDVMWYRLNQVVKAADSFTPCTHS